mmetsp:Transcript_36751/g.105875  ORF Transcript_36751/g.105875 Transcript_36751/m.105875 type:complete len:215 (-) Transcript_36751:985-1629(-)
MKGSSLVLLCLIWSTVFQATFSFQIFHSKAQPRKDPSMISIQRFQLRSKGSYESNILLKAGKKDDEFWIRQRSLMEEMTGQTEKAFQQEQREKFAQRRTALMTDTAIFTVLIFSGLWAFSANPFVSFSYALGSTLGLLYTYGLGRYVETIGGSADDSEMVQGAGIGQARFAFLILLFLFVGKFRSQGLVEIPSIAGFFTYQLASLSQGLREIND